MKKKVLFSQIWDTKDVPHFNDFVKKFENRDCEVLIFPEARTMKTADIRKWMPGVFANICASEEWTAENMDYVKDVKIIARVGVGFETVNIPAATARGIAVTTTPGAGAETVAEYSLAMIAAMTRRIIPNDRLIRGGEWRCVIGHSFYRKTLGIIGLGLIGRQLVKWVKPFGMRVIAYDLTEDHAFAMENGVEYMPLEKLLSECDYMCMHLPLTDKTRGLIGKKELSLMKPTAQIVNAARGGIIDEKALYEALRDKIIDSAALDVFVHEPIERDNPLLTLDNIIFTPHIAGSTYEGLDSITGMAVESVIDFLDGKIPRGIRNPEIFA
jgi:phosphoglycerate dehydrogenase-like enzyme